MTNHAKIALPVLWISLECLVAGCQMQVVGAAADGSNDCSSFLQPDELSPGEGGNADFTDLPRRCLLCEGGDALIPGAIAFLGARLAPLDAELPTGSSLELTSEEPTVLEMVDQRYVDDAPRCSADVRATVRALEVGDATISLQDDRGFVIDRRVYPVREVSTIAVGTVLGTDATSATSPLSNEVAFLFAEARSEDGHTLFTDGAYEWTVDDPSVADFSQSAAVSMPDASGWAVMLTLHDTGSTVVRVRVGDVERTLPLEVTPSGT